ncbi:MAG: GOLPH3/VPS74 family protein [Jatrophihabitans sp.]
MSDLLLAEQLFLLTHDDESGKADGPLAYGSGIAGALLLDLATEGLLEVDDKFIVTTGDAASHPLLTAVLTELRMSGKPRSASHWVNKLPSALKPLDTQVGRSLVERGVLAEDPHKTLGLFASTRWPEVDAAPERALRDQLTAVLANGVEPGRRTELLIALLSPLNMICGLVDKEYRKDAGRRADAIVAANKDGRSISGAVSQSVQAVQAAVMVSVLTPVIVSTTTS